jgi:ribosomal protein S18 acetylase RimI-like enzyme
MSIAEDLKPAWLEQVTIRLAERADLPLLEWEGEYIHFRRVYARAFERAERGNALLWVAQAETGRLLGQVFVLLRSEYDDEVADGRQRAFIHSFRVRSELRGYGLGRRLLAAAEADLKARGFSWVYLHVAQDNDAAMRLYERCGYARMFAVTGDWTYEDHLGQERQVHEPGWRLSKALV